MKKTPKGIRLLDSLPDPFDPKKRVKPRLRKTNHDKPPILASIAPPNTRGNIVDSFLFAIEHRETLGRLIAGSRSRAEARKRLVRECRMSERQADAVLDLRFCGFTRDVCEEFKRELKSSLPYESVPKHGKQLSELRGGLKTGKRTKGLTGFGRNRG